MKINYSISKKGFRIRLDKKGFSIGYPKEIWESFPKKTKKNIVENLVFLSTSTLPTITDSGKLEYNMNSPLMGSFFLKPILYYVPSCAEEYGKDCFTIIKRLMNAKYEFKSYNIKVPEYTAKANNKACILFTFGKDSMLSFALAEEIGLDPELIYIEEPDDSYYDKYTKTVIRSYQNKHKTKLIDDFEKEFRKKKIYRIKNDIALLRNCDYFKVDEAELPWGSQLTEYALLMLPFNSHFKAKYVVYGNEASCSATYYNTQGFLTNPVFDQSGEWTFEISKILRLLTKKVSALSFLEPIHDLAITKILHSRYPHYAKYQTSCLAANNHAKKTRWCHHCSKCARIYIFLLANNIDPKTVGFSENMLKKSKIEYYALFEKIDCASPYDMAGLGRDEQLLAFFLAYKNSAKGYLIDIFKKKHLKEAQKRKKELIKEFYGIHESLTIPKHIRKKLDKIYGEELQSFLYKK